MGGGKKARLPAEYQEVEYLTSSDATANQYVNTQIDVMSANIVVMRYSKESGRTGILVATYSEGNLTIPFGAMAHGVAGSGWTCSPEIEQATLVDKANLTFTRIATGEGTIALMGWKGRTYVPKGSLYSATIYDANDAKIADLVPCYRKVDTAIGLYDTVNQRFCQQTGGIGKGPDVT
jgi:hypothetical protein